MNTLYNEMAKRKLGWLKEHINFEESNIEFYNAQLKKHVDKKHNGICEQGCERCRLLNEIIENSKRDIRDYKADMRDLIKRKGAYYE